MIGMVFHFCFLMSLTLVGHASEPDSASSHGAAERKTSKHPDGPRSICREDREAFEFLQKRIASVERDKGLVEASEMVLASMNSISESYVERSSALTDSLLEMNEKKRMLVARFRMGLRHAEVLAPYQIAELKEKEASLKGLQGEIQTLEDEIQDGKKELRQLFEKTVARLNLAVLDPVEMFDELECNLTVVDEREAVGYKGTRGALKVSSLVAKFNVISQGNTREKDETNLVFDGPIEEALKHFSTPRGTLVAEVGGLRIGKLSFIPGSEEFTLLFRNGSKEVKVKSDVPMKESAGLDSIDSHTLISGNIKLDLVGGDWWLRNYGTIHVRAVSECKKLLPSPDVIGKVEHLKERWDQDPEYQKLAQSLKKNRRHWACGLK